MVTLEPEIFIGAPIEEASERFVLEALAHGYASAGVPAALLANLHIGGRQLDLVVATGHSAWVVEVKHSALKVRGGLNGNWERQHASGRWLPYDNAYQQTLSAKNRLRDAMAAQGALGQFYPDAVVLFTDQSSLSSNLTEGDFKVRVLQQSAFQPFANDNGRSPWSLDDWRAFARSHNLVQVKLEEALAPAGLRERMANMRSLNSAAAFDYRQDGSRWIAESEDFRDAANRSLQTPPGCLISGPTGCGKTLIAKWFAAERAASGDSAIVLPAKDFAGSWVRLLKRELALLSDAPIQRLYYAIRTSHQPIYLIIDGLNELAGDRSSAIREISALARKLGARLIVTDQHDQASALAGLGSLSVSPPSFDLKRRIAADRSGRFNPVVSQLLAAVRSGFEAAMVGELGGLAGVVSRQALVDQFIRLRLGDHGRDGAAGLRRLAQALHSDLAFSMSEVRFDELMLANNVSAVASSAMFASGLLVRRAGRVSFGHEILFRASVAHALAAGALEGGDLHAQMLALPRFEGLVGDILAVIDDEATCRSILAASTDARLLHAATRGEFGELPRQLSNELIAEALAAVEAEIDGLHIVIVPGEQPTLDWSEESVRDWSIEEGARLGAIGHAIDDGDRIDSYLDLCARMDRHLLAERNRLAADIKAAGVINPKSRAFWLAYLPFGRSSGFMHLARNCHMSIRDVKPRNLTCRFDVATMTSGQLYFYLERRHLLLGESNEDRFAEELIFVLKERYRYEPYHVRLAIMDAAGFAGGAADALVEQLIDAINQVLANSPYDDFAVDALKFLGALDESAEMNRAQIEAQVASVIAADDNAEIRGEALGLVSAMFDHPFDHVYYDVIHALPETERCRLLRRALAANDVRQHHILGFLVRQVADLADPVDVGRMQFLAELPDPSNVFPQDEWDGFVIAIRYLGRHGHPLPPRTADTAAGKCLESLRELVHMSERQDDAAAREVWRKVERFPSELVLGCLSEMDDALRETMWVGRNSKWPPLSLTIRFPTECLSVARRFLDNGQEAIHYHRAWDRDRGPQFAFSCIEQHGDRSDLARLRLLARHPRYSRMALRALQIRDTVVGS
jgi:hypothetical protein